MARKRSKARMADPTGQQVRRNRARRLAISRLNRAKSQIRTLIMGLNPVITADVVISNQSHDYQLTDFQQEQLILAANQSIESALEVSGDSPSDDWLYSDQVEGAYRQSTLEEVRDFNSNVAAAIVAGTALTLLQSEPIQTENIILSQQYREELRKARIASFAAVKGVSSKASAQVSNRISAGIRARVSRTQIISDVSDRFDVAKSDIRRVIDTEINTAFNNAKLEATRQISNLTGLRSAVVHISALSTTTRPNHASRHGIAYTVEQQLSWWDGNANRINCKCSVRSVLIDDSGDIINKDVQEQFKQESEFFR